MNAPFDPSLLMGEKFAVGQPVSRKEDPVLLRGEGRYTDDLNLPGPALWRDGAQPRGARRIAWRRHGCRAQTCRACARSSRRRTWMRPASATCRPRRASIATASPTPRPPQRPLATERVRYVGEPIAMVVAETPSTRRMRPRRCSPISTRCPRSPRPVPRPRRMRRCCMTMRRAMSCLDFHYGDSEKVAAAFAQRGARHDNCRCATTASSSARWSRAPRSANTMRRADRLILRLGCQGVFGQRNLLSGILGVPVEKLRVLTGNVGGSFGMKASAYPEYICLLHAARTLGQPVKWTDERSESFLSDSHGRDHEMTAELALDADGQIPRAAGDRLRQSWRLAEQRDHRFRRR